MNTAAPRRDLVLLGGGHSHALVLRHFAMRPLPADVRITLVSDASHAPYSGMLPGLVAGHYGFADTHIDLRSFCAAVGVRFIKARVTGVDSQSQSIALEGRPDLEYDLLSINTGAQPELDSVVGAREFAIPVKPVANFYARWCDLEQRVRSGDTAAGFSISVVGGGAGSVELALAMQYRLADSQVRIVLVCGGQLLEAYNPRARSAVRSQLQARGIELREGARVVAVTDISLQTDTGEDIEHDAVIWCTAATAADWLRESGLPCNEQGFLRLRDSLQLDGHETLFAAGDVATQTRNPRPKAGVYAVRQAPFLAENLRAALTGAKLREYRPQRRFLSLLALGDKTAVADRGVFSASGGWVWRWKDRIDRQFMRQFSEPPQMPASTVAAMVMHCGGCGAKLPALLLRDVLAEMAQRYPAVVDAEQFGDDAAVLQTRPEKLLVQSVDSLRQLLDDPWQMGRIAALHALSDIYAMGAQPVSCLTQLTLPYAGPELQRRDLALLMDGALSEMNRAGCRLLGGHSLEGPELSLGFTVNGEVAAAQMLAKTTVAEGDHLVLTKPLGTGVLFAAQAQGKADSRWIDAALETMLLSNARAAELAREFGLHTATDVTGFGLAGHLLEMLHSEHLQACLSLSALPLIDGAEAALAAGIRSTLQPANIENARPELSPGQGSRYQVLFDPQTSGGLLFAVPQRQLPEFLQALQESGYPAAAEIGYLQALPAAAGKLLLQT